MNKRFISIITCTALCATICTGFATTASAEAKVPQYQEIARPMEELNRGLIASFLGTGKGVYLSWRLLGKESLENQAFDIYRGTTRFSKIKTTGATDPTWYIDTTGKKTDKYIVVPAGTPKEEAVLQPVQMVDTMTNHLNNGGSLKNSYAYVDIPIERPAPNGGGNYYTTSTAEGGANDASVGDLDGDGDYEIVLKWDPTNSKDAAGGGSTGRTYIDGYEIDPKNNDASKNENGHLYKWRIDLGPHVRSGAHENPFLVYDFDGDGKSEIVSITGLGATDGNGEYVTKVGDTEEIRNADNSKTFLRKGKNIGPEYYTIFDGETGAALCTTDAIPIGPPDEHGVIDASYHDGHYYGDAKMNRSSRYLAAVAYVDGVHPSAVMCRGYYNRAMLRAYTWDGVSLKMQWEHTGDKKGSTLYGSGNHNLSVGDIDGDGKDEIVYGSASLDDDGKTVLGYTPYGHGDAMHLSDFNNDGAQEVFSVKEDGEGFKKQAENLRVASTGACFWNDGKLVTSGDNGRGVMDNIDDAYAKSEYDKGNTDVMAIGWSSGFSNAHDFKGNDLKAKPAKAGNGSFDNFLVYWDGDLGRELLDSNIIQKYDAANGYTNRFYGDDGSNSGYTLTGGTTNNYTKRNVCLSADLWGDWREEIIMATGKGQNETPALRIFTSTLPTDYRLTTLMHDSQYRLAIAWQNVGYNQPPHTSYYIGSIALATDENGNTLNYLAPAAKYTKVKYPSDDWVAVTGVDMPSEKLRIERSHEVDTGARILPEDATRQAIKWTSSDENVVQIVGGKAIGVAPGTATITAVTADGGFTASREVEVWSTPVTGISLISNNKLDMQIDETSQVSVSIAPQEASDKNVRWTSSNEAVATVSSQGVITAVSGGLAAIYATTVDGGYKTGCMVNVIPKGMVDLTGDDIFKTTNTDSETTLSGASAMGATLSQNAAKTGGEMSKDFDVTSDGKATLTYRITTGGQKDSSDAWKWEGREYTFGMSLLDENGNNILTVAQPYLAGGAGNMTSKTGDEAAVSFDSDWSGDRGDIQGSTKRWLVTLEFDYDTDTCDATIVGTDATWAAENGKKTKTFSLNGAHLKTLKCYTTLDNAEGAITASPIVANVLYEKTVEISGSNVNIYKRGEKTGTSWSNSDISDWNTTGTEVLSISEETPRLWYNPQKPAAAYSAEKTFENIADTGVLTYDIDWHFGNATNRIGNVEYLQIGSDMRLGWMSADGGYYVFPSKDGGASYNGVTEGAADASKAVLSEKGIHTKKVKVEIDVATRTVKSFTFDGKDVTFLKGYVIPETSTFNSVKFGFDRIGSTEGWDYPNGIENITVSQFGEGLTQKFNIKFVDGDTVLKSDLLEAGTTPSYDGNTPVKEEDDKYTYTFKGWTPNIIDVIDDAVYAAEYSMTPRTYSVTLNKNGGTVETDVTTYTYGTEITLPVPVRDGYIFGGWYTNEQFTGTAVTSISNTETGDKAYYAKWKVIPKVKIGDFDGVNVPVSVVTAEDFASIQLIGALYDGDILKEIKAVTVRDIKTDVEQSEMLIFDNNPADYTLKVFAWDALEKMTPLTDKPEIKEKTE